MSSPRPLAVVTGASSGIGYELAKCFAADGYDLILAADRPLQEAVQGIRSAGDVDIQSLETDLSTKAGVHKLVEFIEQSGRKVDALAANAGVGLGHAFLDQEPDDFHKVVDTNVAGTVHLIWHIGRQMRDTGRGKILITSSIASLMPGSYQAVYNATKSFLQSFSFALREELKDTGVTVTALMPGPTDTNFFERAGMMDTKVGRDEKKDDPAMVAKTGYEAMLKGEGDVVAGLKNTLQATMSRTMTKEQLAAMHTDMAKPRTGEA